MICTTTTYTPTTHKKMDLVRSHSQIPNISSPAQDPNLSTSHLGGHAAMVASEMFYGLLPTAVRSKMEEVYGDSGSRYTSAAWRHGSERGGCRVAFWQQSHSGRLRGSLPRLETV